MGVGGSSRGLEGCLWVGTLVSMPGWPSPLLLNLQASPLSCCALARDGGHVMCSGWLRKSTPEKKLSFCVSGTRGSAVLSLGSRRGWDGAAGGPRVAGRGQGSIFFVGSTVHSSSSSRRGHKQGSRRTRASSRGRSSMVDGDQLLPRHSP
jgi:hypothetical protein